MYIPSCFQPGGQLPLNNLLLLYRPLVSRAPLNGFIHRLAGPELKKLVLGYLRLVRLLLLVLRRYR